MRIDFHRHLFQRDGEEESLLRYMDTNGIDRTIMAPLPACLTFMGCPLTDNPGVLQLVKKHPDRLTGAIYLDLRDPKAIDTLDRYHDHGFRLVKLWPPVGYYPDDPAYYPVYEHIAKL